MAGGYAHLIGVDTVHSLVPNRPRVKGPDRSSNPPASFDQRLSDALARLPILLAHVLWLIDVCGCTYQTAAAELGTSPERVEQMVAEARRQLRQDLAPAARPGRGPERVSDPRRSPGGSTNPYRPGWQRPGR